MEDGHGQHEYLRWGKQMNTTYRDSDEGVLTKFALLESSDIDNGWSRQSHHSDRWEIGNYYG